MTVPFNRISLSVHVICWRTCIASSNRIYRYIIFSRLLYIWHTFMRHGKEVDKRFASWGRAKQRYSCGCKFAYVIEIVKSVARTRHFWQCPHHRTESLEIDDRLARIDRTFMNVISYRILADATTWMTDKCRIYLPESREQISHTPVLEYNWYRKQYKYRLWSWTQ